MDDEEKDGCVECMRYGFVMINSLFLLLGVGLLFLGVWFYAVPANNNFASIALEPEEQNELSVGMLLVIGVGTGVCLLALISCCGAFSKRKCILVVIGLILLILLLLQLVIVAFCMLYHEQIKGGITDQMARTLAFDYTGDDGESRESIAWREMQKGFHCCGVNTTQGYRNHTQMTYMNITGSLWYRTVGEASSREWPSSCCEVHTNTSEHGDIACSKENSFLNEQGCADEMAGFFQTHLLGIIATAGILVAFEVLAIVLSFKLFRVIPKKKTYSWLRRDDLYRM